MIAPPLKWHGGKHYLASRIVSLFPPRGTYTHYVEPYFGGGSVLLAHDPEGVSEVANDANGELSNFWGCLQHRHAFDLMRRQLEATPFSEREWQKACEPSPLDSGTDRAIKFFVRCRQSLAGRMKAFTGVTRSRTRRGMNAECSAWLNAIDGLPAVHERLKRVLILNRPALDAIRTEDGPGTLFYLDPPYLHETRATTGEYAHEMTERDHEDLLLALTRVKLKGRFLLSGYRSELYDEFAYAWKWQRHDFDLPNNAAAGSEKRRMTECVWTNYYVAPPARAALAPGAAP